MFKKKEKAPLEPQYYESPTGIPTYNYKVYYMSKAEKIIYFLIAFIVGAAVGYLFYGGIGKDDLGNATTVTYVLDIIVCVLVGGIAGKMFLPIRTQQIIKKRKNDLKLQFRELLDALATSIGRQITISGTGNVSGRNVFHADSGRRTVLRRDKAEGDCGDHGRTSQRSERNVSGNASILRTAIYAESKDRKRLHILLLKGTLHAETWEDRFR